MKKRIYPKAIMLIGVFPLVSVSLVGFFYVILGTILTELGLLPLDVQLMVNYHIVTVSAPVGLVSGIIYWNSRRITIEKDELVVRAKYSKVKRTRIKMGDIIEVCTNEQMGEVKPCFHIHTKEEDIILNEKWYDEEALNKLVNNITKENPEAKLHTLKLSN